MPVESKQFLQTLKKVDDLDFKKRIEMQKDFAKFYLEKYINKKIPIQKLSFFTIFKNNVNIVPSNLGITFPMYLATTAEKREMLPLKSFIIGEEVTVLDVTFQQNNDFSLYSDEVLIKVSYKDEILNVPLPTFDEIFLVNDDKAETPLSSDYPKHFKYCDSKISNKKAYTVEDMQANLKTLKESNIFLKDVGVLYPDSNGTYCFDTSVTDLESELSIVMNHAFVFQARVEVHE